MIGVGGGWQQIAEEVHKVRNKRETIWGRNVCTYSEEKIKFDLYVLYLKMCWFRRQKLPQATLGTINNNASLKI